MSVAKYILIPVIVIGLAFVGPLVLEVVKPTPFVPLGTQEEVTRVGMLISGIKPNTPDEFGYMSSPLRIFSESALSPYQRFRLKKWDAFDVITDDFILQGHIADLGYMAKIKVFIFDYKTRKYSAYSKILLPHEIPTMSTTSYKFYNSTQDDILYESGEFKFHIHNHDNAPTKIYQSREIKVSAPSEKIDINLVLNMTNNHEVIGMITPISADKSQFFYNLKYANIPVSGSINFEGKQYQVNEFSKGGAGLDWGRGVWPYNSFWVWARGQGSLENGQRFGLNFGGGFAHNTSQATEDAFFIERYMSKLNAVEYNYDDNNLMNPWTFKTHPSKDFRECDVVFKPNYVTTDSLNFILLKSEMRLVFGQFSGWVTNQHGLKYRFEDINGVIEVHKAKW